VAGLDRKILVNPVLLLLLMLLLLLLLVLVEVLNQCNVVLVAANVGWDSVGRAVTVTLA
jgi:hypothetical protein